ncbi:ATP-grasp domain-containing protein [Geodermatophilus sp. DSM 44513]|uniref:ATP-grasp domain-containing protein n=1 Tax=Geodermatophilus sp. DSM 44513 TaxID=1528104 RepID=UPI001280CD66|nr:ATP-grasp domain-containing protein [Geodermatophilus sp. DSM 44513]WNV73568.1 ATP-grasp domain-containing protein [Geodermatophilus sp. DSM 44513]
MRVLLVITDVDWYEDAGYAAAWVRALEEQGAEVERLARVPADWPVSGPPRGRYDLAIAHVLVEEVVGYAPTFALAVLLEAAGVPLLNPVASLVASADKLVTHAVWAAAGVPQPAAWDLARLTEWPLPGRRMVLKPALGDGARYIELVGDLDAAHAVDAAWRAAEAAGGHRRGAALLQEWIAEPACARVFATPAATSLVYEKSRAEGALVTHGTVYPRVYEAPPAMAQLAQRTVAALGGGLMGVDVLVEPGGRLLALEANAPFGFDVTDPQQARWVARAALTAAERAAAARSAAA